MHSVAVEIAFNAGFATPAASRTWTDVSDYVELQAGVSVTGGRGDERGTVDANSLTLTLDNRDGRFTPGRSASPYYPNVKIGKPIRVRVTPEGGTAAYLFVGYVDQWPMQWDGSDQAASVTVTASSRLARLGLTAEMRSIVEEQYLADSPVAYYTLGEAAGATTAADCSGRGAASLGLGGDGSPVTFGQATGPATDDLTAATFNGGQFLTAINRGVTSGAATPLSDQVLEAFIVTSTAPADSFVCLVRTEGDYYLGIRITAAGKAQGYYWNAALGIASTLTSATTVKDGLLHHVALVVDTPDSTTLYVDGVSEGATAAWGAGVGIERLSVGGGRLLGDPTPTFNGTIAHVALTQVALSASRIAAHSAAGLTGFAGDTPATRLNRYADFLQVPTAERSFATGASPVAHIDTTGSTTLDLMRRVETTESGVLFDAKSGALTFHGRSTRYAQASAVTLDMAAQDVESTFAPMLDRSTLVNDVTATSATTSGRAVDTASRDAYGLARDSVALDTTDPEEPLQAASWRVSRYAEPRVRVPALDVNLTHLPLAQQQAILGTLDVGARLTVSNQPSQAPVTTEDYFVEGYAYTLSPAAVTVSLNVSPATLWQVFTLDSATLGQLDNDVLAY